MGEHHEQRAAREERCGKRHKVGDAMILRVGPPARELVGCARLFSAFVARFLPACGVRVVLGVGSVGDNEDLHILEQTALAPEAFALIPLNLVEGLTQRHAATLELDVHERETVDENGDVVSILVSALVRLVLIEHLQAVLMDVVAVKELDVDERAVPHREVNDRRFLDDPGLIDNTVRKIGDLRREEGIPILISKGEVVELFNLIAQV